MVCGKQIGDPSPVFSWQITTSQKPSPTTNVGIPNDSLGHVPRTSLAAEQPSPLRDGQVITLQDQLSCCIPPVEKQRTYPLSWILKHHSIFDLKNKCWEPGKDRELMGKVHPCVCCGKPQEVVRFCKEAMGTVSCLWISACVSVLCFQLYLHINCCCLLLHLYSSLQWLFWDLTKHSWKNELLAVLNKCEKNYSLSSGSWNVILALMCSTTFMINLCIVRGACEALLDQGMLFCIKKILITSSNYFVITLLHELRCSCWCAIVLVGENWGLLISQVHVW